MSAAEAVEARDYARLAELVAAGDASLTALDCYGQAPIHIAAEAGDATALSALLQSSASSADLPDCMKRTALHFAAQANSAECVALLLSRGGADVDARDCDFATPLMYACKAGCDAAARALFAGPQPPDIDARDTANWTALFYAAANSRADLCRLLQDKGASRDLRDGRGRTPLDVAREREFDMP